MILISTLRPMSKALAKSSISILNQRLFVVIPQIVDDTSWMIDIVKFLKASWSLKLVEVILFLPQMRGCRLSPDVLICIVHLYSENSRRTPYVLMDQKVLYLKIKLSGESTNCSRWFMPTQGTPNLWQHNFILNVNIFNFML